MAYIHKHGDGWRAQVAKLGIRRTSVWASKREATEWATRLEAEIAAGKFKSERKTHTLGDAISRYATTVSVNKEGGKWEVRRLNAMQVHFGADTALLDIDTPQIAEWRDTRLKTVTTSTVVREVNLLRNLFNIARLEWKWMDNKPFEGVKIPKENPPRTEIWTWQLIKRILRANRSGKTQEMQIAFHIALRTGMRLAEVLKAPTNFDSKAQVVSIKTKTEANAKIPIGRIATRLIQQASFTVSANEGSTLFSKLCRELLITGLTFHDSRGTALTHLSRKVDVLTLAKISRHKDLSLLSNVYYRETANSIASRI